MKPEFWDGPPFYDGPRKIEFAPMAVNGFEFLRMDADLTEGAVHKAKALSEVEEASMTEVVRRAVSTCSFLLERKAMGEEIYIVGADMEAEELNPIEFPESFGLHSPIEKARENEAEVQLPSLDLPGELTLTRLSINVSYDVAGMIVSLSNVYSMSVLEALENTIHLYFDVAAIRKRGEAIVTTNEEGALRELDFPF